MTTYYVAVLKQDSPPTIAEFSDEKQAHVEAIYNNSNILRCTDELKFDNEMSRIFAMYVVGMSRSSLDKLEMDQLLEIYYNMMSVMKVSYKQNLINKIAYVVKK